MTPRVLWSQPGGGQVASMDQFERVVPLLRRRVTHQAAMTA